MSEQPEDTNNLLNLIAATVETIRDQMATKSDIARLEAKMEVESTAVRGDIEQIHLAWIQSSAHSPRGSGGLRRR